MCVFYFFIFIYIYFALFFFFMDLSVFGKVNSVVVISIRTTYEWWICLLLCVSLLRDFGFDYLGFAIQYDADSVCLIAKRRKPTMFCFQLFPQL